MRRLASFLAVAALLAAATVVPMGTAGAGVYTVDVALVSPVEPLTFSATVVNVGVEGPLCDSVSLLTVEADGTAVTPLSETSPDTDSVRFTLPSDTAPGTLTVEVECLMGEFPYDYSGERDFGALAVTKAVDGTVPADATFTVLVACDGASEVGVDAGAGYSAVGSADLDPSADIELTFGATGGTRYVYFDDESVCTISEPLNGGATSTTITPQVIVNSEPAAYATSVVNTFATAVEPNFTG